MLLVGCQGAPALPPSDLPAPILPSGGATLLRGPYLQDVSDSAATVIWRTTAATTGGLSIGPADAPASVRQIGETQAATDHVLRVDGLRPNTIYRYQVLAGGAAASAEIEFRTAPTPGAPDPFTFAVWGDSGCGCPAQMAVAGQIARTQPNLLLHTGDLIYETGQAEGYDPFFFSPYSPTLATAPFYPVLGNHDDLTANGAPWLETFVLPGGASDHTTRYYSFNWGNAHFIALDSEEDYGPTSRQYNWLLADLASPAAQSATWRFAYFHRPPYSSGYGHGSSFTLRETWSPLFERFGVDVVFNGHEHNYERTTPRRDYAALGGTHPVVYVVTGGGGKQEYNVGHQEWTAFSEMVYHFVQVHIDGPHLKLEAIDENGKVFDQMELNH